MAIVVIPLMINGPSHLIYCAPAKTAPPLRSRSQRLWEIAGESPGMKPEPTEIRGKMTRPRQAQEALTGRRNNGGASESWSRSENPGRWAQCGATRVSSVPVEARSYARTRGRMATGGNA